jgi:hypothetical protein
MKRIIAILVLAIWNTTGFSATSPQTIDLSSSWKFKPEPVGKMLQWQMPNLADSDWDTLHAGTRWEDQGFPDLDGYAWYRKAIDVPESWRGQQIWLILGAVNDAFALFCNGHFVNEFGDSISHNVANIPSLANLTPFLNPGKRNVLALRVLDWGGSGGLWQPPCLLTKDPAVIDTFPVLFCEPALDETMLDVNLNLTQLGRHWRHTRLNLLLRETKTNKTLQQQSQQMQDDPGILSFQFKWPEDLKAYSCRIETKLTTESGTVLLHRAKTLSSEKITLAAKSNHKILNNFVTELARQPLATASQAVRFENPRDGWVFMALEGGAGKIRAKLVGPDTIIWRMNPTTQVPEAMLYLNKGSYTLQLASAARGELIIRAIPEIIYSQYPCSPHLEPFGPYDWDFLTRHVLSHVNTIVTSGVPAQVDEWRAEGRKWLANHSLPGLADKQPPSTSQVYESWAASPGVHRPEYGGIIVDEFMLRPVEYYRPWTEAMLALYKNPSFAGKHFYAYCNDLFQNPHLPAYTFSQALLQHGGRFALERYLPLLPSEAEAQALLQEELQQAVLAGSQHMPELKQHLVVCLGYLCDPPEMLNRLPQVNYKVFMDMQFHFLATNSAFAGLYGLQEYLSSYADEEVLRWAHKLFRHYCIEGHRTRFTDEPYQLPHLKNPDFVDGLNHWQAEPAATGSITPGTLAGFSWLQGRYPQIATGDQGMVFKRSAQRPNRLRQILQSLKPGQWYSLKIISANMNQLDVKQSSGLSVEIKNSLTDQNRTFSYLYPSNYAHTFGPYHVDHPAWMNYQRVIFQAKGTSAELTISDWSNGTTPGGPAGQEIIFNFIEVRPYLLAE